MNQSNAFLQHFPIQRVRSSILDDALANEPQRLVLLFLWGEDCPSCEQAMHDLLRSGDRCHWPQVRWLHDEVYGDPALPTRFGLHGVPTFLLFYRTRLLGRITRWPGSGAFIEVVERQLLRHGLSDGPTLPQAYSNF